MPSPGYLYVLRNAAFGSYVVKIGFTKKAPNVRAKEIYSGTTGVPIPFDVAVAYSVADGRAAETKIHARLSAYRLNARREFFRIPPTIASRLCFETCCEVNSMFGTQDPQEFRITRVASPESRLDFIETEGATGYANAEGLLWKGRMFRIRSNPTGTSNLVPEQMDRIRTVALILSKVSPDSIASWQESFSRDTNPERELQVWEHIAKAFLTVDQLEGQDIEFKKEAFRLLLARSAATTAEVLRQVPLRYFSRKAAKHLLQAYEMRPFPLTMRLVKRHP